MSLRNLAAMFLIRGFSCTHEAVREWEARFAPLLTARVRAKRRGKAGLAWYADETSITVDGRWCDLSRAIDADGTLVDSLLSETREKVTTDGHDAYPRAIRATWGPEVQHRTSRSMNKRMEQDQRGITQRSNLMRGCGSCDAAARFCSAPDDLRDHVRYRQHLNETVSLADQRPPGPGAVGHRVRAAAGGVSPIRLGPPQADARHSLLAFRLLTLPEQRAGDSLLV